MVSRTRARPRSPEHGERQFSASLHATALAIMQRVELPPLLLALVQRVARLMQARHGFLFLEAPGGAALECRVWTASRKAAFFDASAAVAERVWRSGAPLALADYDMWRGRSAQVPRGVLGSVAVVPVLFEGRVRGGLGLAYGRSANMRRGKPALDRLKRFAQLAALALDSAALFERVTIENARLSADAKQQLTERERTQAELQRSERRYREIFDGGLGLICTHDLQGVLSSVNRAALQSLGFAASDMLGHSLRDFLTEAGRAEFPGYLARLSREGESSGVMPILDANGREHLWRYRNVLRDDAHGLPSVIGFAHDVTDETRARHALRESEERLRQLAESVDAVFFMRQLDPPEVLYMSPSYARLFGREPGELRPQFDSLLADVHPEDQRRVALAFARDQNGSFDEHYRIVRPDGGVRWIHTRTFPVGASGSRLVGVSADVTLQKNAETLREDLTRTLVHDLRSPLTAISASLQLIEVFVEDRVEAKDAVLTGLHAAGKLRTLIDGVLDIERLEQGSLPLERRPTVMGELVADVLALMTGTARARQIALTAEVLPGLPLAYADAQLIQRVIENLVGNALKFTPSGGSVSVSVGLASGGAVELRVRDTGPGIAEAVAPRLFQKFSSGRGAGAGSGLGLAFCRLVVEAHGGRIAVLQSSNVGSVIGFTLPPLPPPH